MARNDAQEITVKKAKRSKFKCATTGKHSCEECGREIERGETIRFVDVKYSDGTHDHLTFCCKEHRNAYCDRENIPQ